MPPHCQMSIDDGGGGMREMQSLGIGGVILFGLPETKDEDGLRRL